MLIKSYVVHVSPVGADFAGLRDFLLLSAAIRDAAAVSPDAYLCRTELSAQELSRFVGYFVPNGAIIAQIDPRNFADTVECIDARDFLSRPVPPPRGLDHVPTTEDIELLPPEPDDTDDPGDALSEMDCAGRA